jgi:ligand-binding SRPBCC domain-containing protein
MMMRIEVLRREQALDGTPEELFGFFADAFALEAMTPPALRFEVVTPAPIAMREGAIIRYRLRLRGVPIRWDTLIAGWDPPRRFVDLQVRGPYRLWHHAHELEPLGAGRTLMRDTVRYAIGFGPLGALAHRLWVRRELEAIFDFRAARVVELLRSARTR